MFDQAIKISMPINRVMDAVLNACKTCKLKVMVRNRSEKKFKITAREKLDIFSMDYCGAALNISGFKIEDGVLVTIVGLCTIYSSDQEILAKGIADNFTNCLGSMLGS